jgi:Protein of unknown function (DUF2735)
MDRSPDRQSAKILTFPTRRRAGASELGNKAKFAAEVALLRTMTIAGESAWYHEAEIEDAARNRKH